MGLRLCNAIRAGMVVGVDLLGLIIGTDLLFALLL